MRLFLGLALLVVLCASASAVHSGVLKHVQSGKCANLILPGESELGDHTGLPDTLIPWVELSDECERRFIFDQGVLRADGSGFCIYPIRVRDNKGQVVDFVLGEDNVRPCDMEAMKDTFYFNPKGHLLHRASKKCVEPKGTTLHLGQKCDNTFKFIRR